MTNDRTAPEPAGGTPVERPVVRPVPGRADLRMLTMAADAIGLQWEWHQGYGDALHLTAPDAAAIFWSPLRSDADALALAVRMEMDVFVRAGRWTEAVRPMGPACKEAHNGDPLAATRRAIVRAAVEDRVTHNVANNRQTAAGEAGEGMSG